MIGEKGLLKQLTKKLAEHALKAEMAEMAEHFDHARHEPVATLRKTAATASAKRPSKANSANCRLTFPVTATVASSPTRLQAANPLDRL